MRKLLWFTVGFTAVCGWMAYGLPWGFLLPGAVGAAGVVLWKLGKQKTVSRVLPVFIGCVVGFGWFCAFFYGYLGPARAMDGTTAQTVVEITDYSYEMPYGVGAEGEIRLGGTTYSVRVYRNEPEVLEPGDRLEGSFRFRLTEGGREPDTYHGSMGIPLLLYPEGESERIPGNRIPVGSWPAWLRRQASSILEQAFPADTGGFALALLLGDSGKIDYATDTALKLSGIRHIIAVSGLHVSILCAMLLLLTGRGRFSSLLLAVPVLALFAGMVGHSPSVTRACVMTVLLLAATALERQYDPPTALSAAVLGMTATNPLAVTSVSLQLSVGCLAGIFLFAKPLGKFLEQRLYRCFPKRKKAVRWLAASVSVSLGAMSLTTPLSAWYFGSVSLIGVVTNLLVLWIIGFIFYGVLAVCLLGAVFLPLGRAAAWLVSWPVRYVLAAAKLAAKFPLAAVYTKSPAIVIWLFAGYLLAAILLLGKKRRPGLFCGLTTLGLCAALTWSWFIPLLDTYRVTVLDVGQGQSILLQSGDTVFLVDCGGDRDAVAADMAAETLLSQGISRVDGVILTHTDRDHAGGLAHFLSRIPADRIFLPEGGEAAVSGTVVEDNLEISWDRGKITLFSGDPHGKSNNSSMCVLFQTKKCAILITGDRDGAGELALLEQMALPKLDLLVVGHHGSRSASSAAFLEAVSPKRAVISVGTGNPYGHPHPDVLERLEAAGIPVDRTDTDGTILYRG